MKQKKVNYDPFTLINKFDSLTTFKNYLTNLQYKVIKTNKKISYLNLSCSFDTETSSFYDNAFEKVSLMYAFTIGINGHSYLGRSKDDFISIIRFIIDTFKLSKERRLIIYVHNLGYDFQFIRKWVEWISLFAIDKRTPAKAVTFDGIEFRCSLLLSGYSLAKVGEHLQKYKVEKLVGALDYRKLRTPLTPLTTEETNYILNDGLVVMAYIQEQIESHKNDITKIPLTKTGEVRKYCRNMCLYNGGGSHKKTGRYFQQYHYFISNLTIQSVNEYKQLKRAFAGGFTHANPLVVNSIQHQVTSFDFTSSYPAVMLTEKFPMTKGRLRTIKTREEFDEYLDLYCCVFDVTFTKLESKYWFEHYISESHCYARENLKVDNGRIISADMVSLTITEQDYFIIAKTYKWESMKVKNFRTYQRDYLPKEFILAIINLYKKKTELKDVAGFEAEYLNSKELLNSCYGMCVTDICREDVTYDLEHNEWNEETTPVDYEKEIEKYNKQKQRFLAYQWGVWVTAYARSNLWNGILSIKEDYCYSDTDSLKVINIENHEDYFTSYNANMIKKLKRMCKHYDIPFEEVAPKTITGETKIIGLWSREFVCDFKTLGAKRYIVKYTPPKKGKEYEITIAGLNKDTTMDYFTRFGLNPFETFKNGMYIPATYVYENNIYIGTGKNTHTYIDSKRNGIVKDYLGKNYEYHVESCVHMEEADYTLSMSSEFVELLLKLERKEYN